MFPTFNAVSSLQLRRPRASTLSTAPAAPDLVRHGVTQPLTSAIASPGSREVTANGLAVQGLQAYPMPSSQRRIKHLHEYRPKDVAPQAPFKTGAGSGLEGS